MRDTDLLQTALGLAAPWVVSGSRFDAVARRLDIDLAFAGARGLPVRAAVRRDARSTTPSRSRGGI
jgi:hypothetical protein